MRFIFINCVCFLHAACFCQEKLQWKNVDSLYRPLPSSVHVFYTEQQIDTGRFRAFYVIADLKDKNLDFTTDTTFNRRLTPAQFYQKNQQPLVVVNGTFFSFETNRNLNVVIRNGKVVSHNVRSIAGRGKDTFTYRHPITGAIGISKKRKADVAWAVTDSSKRIAYGMQASVEAFKDSFPHLPLDYFIHNTSLAVGDYSGRRRHIYPQLKKWKMQTAIGGGPVLLQSGAIKISNNEELKFSGKAINDQHPRTAMGYTADNKLVILVIEGRNPDAGGATLTQEAQILKGLGCIEALNLDGGGSSCLLINGKETIKPSDKVQRAVPAVFLIKATSR